MTVCCFHCTFLFRPQLPSSKTELHLCRDDDGGPRSRRDLQCKETSAYSFPRASSKPPAIYPLQLSDLLLRSLAAVSKREKIPVSGNRAHHPLMMLNARRQGGSEAWLTQGGSIGHNTLRKANSRLFQTTTALYHKRFLSSPIITENSLLFSGPSCPLHRTQRE